MSDKETVEVEATTLESATDLMERTSGEATFAIVDGKPSLTGIEELRHANAALKGFIESYDYTGTEEERKANTKFLATVRKYSKAVSQGANKWKKALFADFDVDVKAIIAEISDIESIAVERKDAADKAFVEERKQMLAAQFANTAVVDEHLAGIAPDAVIDASLTLRSLTDKKAKAELDARIATIDSVVKRNMMPEVSPNVAVGLLAASNWDLNAALDAYDERVEAEREAAALAEQRERQRAERAAAAAGFVTLSFRVKKEDADALRAAVESSGVAVEEV